MLRAGAIGGAALAAFAALPSLIGTGAPPAPPSDVGLATLPSPPVALAPAGSAAPGEPAVARATRGGAPRHPLGAGSPKAGSGPAGDGWGELVRAAEDGRLGPRAPVGRTSSRSSVDGPRERRPDAGRSRGDAQGGSDGGGGATTASYLPSHSGAGSSSSPSSSGASRPGEFRFEH